MKKKFTGRASNEVEPAAPASVWGYKGCAGKGGKTQNAVIVRTNETEKETTNHE